MNKLTKRAAVLSLAVAAYPGGASAQQLEVEEIIVTAQKRAERTIDVPMSLTVLSAQDIEQRGISSIQDLSFAVPGVTMRVDGPGSMMLFMRGIGNLAGGEAVAAVYMDETPVTLYSYRQIDLRALDIDHIEVLKGPQGTLYGQGAVAGAVRFITAKPKMDRIEGKVAADVSFIDGGDSNEKITGVLNVPLVTDKLAVRIAATGEQGGGWIDQPGAGIEDGNNQDITNVRAKVRWLPTERLAIDLTAASYRLTSELGLDYETADHRVNMPISDDWRIRRRLDEYGLYSLTATYDLGSAELIATGSYIDYYREYALPYIAGPGTYSYANRSEGVSTYDDQSFQSSEEVRLVSKGDSAFKYTLGAYHRNVKSDYYGLSDGLFDGALFTDSEYIEKYESDSWSFFADGSIKVGERGEIGAGIRSFRDRVTQFGGFPLDTYKDTFTSTDPRVYGSYALTDDVKLYANVAKGFRSGGFNLFPAVAYGPEKAINYEIGSKGVIRGARLSYEIAVFFTDYDDMLRRGVVQLPGGAFQNLTSNIGRAEIKGLEVGFGWRPAEQLMLSVSGTYLDGEVVEVNAVNRPDEITSANNVGDKVDYVPKFSYTIAADYSFDWGAGVAGFVHLDLNHRDQVYYTDRFLYVPEAVQQSSDSVTLLGARIGATWRQLSVELFGNNLTNENRLVDPFDIWSQANRTKPRTFGVKTTYSF